jgi:hypothetical protein
MAVVRRRRCPAAAWQPPTRRGLDVGLQPRRHVAVGFRKRADLNVVDDVQQVERGAERLAARARK